MSETKTIKTESVIERAIERLADAPLPSRTAESPHGREDPPIPPAPDTELRGFVESVADPSFTILGVTINTNGGTQFVGIPGAGGVGDLKIGNQVSVEGTEISSTAIQAVEVELED